MRLALVFQASASTVDYQCEIEGRSFTVLSGMYASMFNVLAPAKRR
jgi:hypothetical protein